MASSSDAWMREYNEALKLSEDINGMMSERNSSGVTGPDAQRRASAIRRKITILGTRLDSLQSLLVKVPGKQHVSEKEMNRRKDMVGNLRSKANQVASALNMSNFANRDSLLGPETKPDDAMNRVSGMDNQGIVGFQRQVMRVEQDEGLEKLEETVMSTKHIALAVNEELTLQTRLIEDLDYHVDVTDSRLRRVQKSLAVMNKNMKGGCSCMSMLLSVLGIVGLALVIWLLVKYLPKEEMVESKYEQIRLKRVEENKKRMIELNLNKLSHSLRLSSPSPKPSPAKARTPRTPVDSSEVRRSSRAKNPPPSYKEFGLEPLERPRRSYQRKDLLNRVYASDDARVYAIDRAEALQSSLEPEFPSFIKPMLQSHVTGGFWLGLPRSFCHTHLPKYDEMITLVDENEDEAVTKYLADKNGLSGGWRGFAIDHQLVDGDAVVFHLINPTTFKVYIIRVNDESNNGSGGSNEKELVIKPNKNQEEKNVSEVPPLSNSGKRKRRGNNICHKSLSC
ncbi:unnamed protein product [Brassica napus]|uniref:(rape) hypothetical protein n=1 Tax=Brassica napus TaxID=3708 RepID=A0A816R1D0_BRANA|nr:unnamed protein product [Brassica napus]